MGRFNGACPKSVSCVNDNLNERKINKVMYDLFLFDPFQQKTNLPRQK